MIYRKPARKRRAVLFGLLPVLFALVLPAHPQEPCQAGLKPEVEHLLPPVEIAPTKIRVVTFNVHYAHDIPELAKGIQANPALRTADIFLIQEIEIDIYSWRAVAENTINQIQGILRRDN